MFNFLKELGLIKKEVSRQGTIWSRRSGPSRVEADGVLWALEALADGGRVAVEVIAEIKEPEEELIGSWPGGKHRRGGRGCAKNVTRFYRSRASISTSSSRSTRAPW